MSVRKGRDFKMSKLGTMDGLAKNQTAGDFLDEFTERTVADARHQPQLTEARASGSSATFVRAGVDPVLLESRLEHHSDNQLNAAAGIMNGVISGIAFWILAIILYNLFRFI